MLYSAQPRSRGSILPQKTGKHTPFFELVDAQTKAGCPICRLVYKATSRYLESLLYEAVLDPDIRAKLKRAQGFCADHTEILRSKPGRALGIALIYRDIVRAIAETADSERYRRPSPSSAIRRLTGRDEAKPRIVDKLTTHEPCPACAVGDDSERYFLDLLVAYLDDDQLYDAYSQGEGLCLPHLLRAFERVEDDGVFGRLVRPQVTRYLAMLGDLDEFIRKHDHRFTDEAYGEEGDVWLRAINAIVGGAGMGLSARSGGRRASDLDEYADTLSAGAKARQRK